MTSFASFVSTYSFKFSMDFISPITQEDEEVWSVYFSARTRPTKEAKENSVKEWISSNECPVCAKAQLARQAGAAEEVAEKAKDAKGNDQGKKLHPWGNLNQEQLSCQEREGARDSPLWPPRGPQRHVIVLLRRQLVLLSGEQRLANNSIRHYSVHGTVDFTASKF
ncbi:hypothetical protein Aduo_005238 [Ancylostoma duodenale]